MLNSTTKPKKPYPDFPLFAHNNGRWAKKIWQKLVYFGKWEDPDAALTKWLEQKDELLAGRTPRPKTEGLTVVALANRFLAAKKTLENCGELSPRTFYGYYHTCEMLLRVFGKQRVVNDLRTEDFETVRAVAFKGLGMESRSGVTRRVRALFNFAYNEGLIDRPVRFGSALKAPSAKNQQKDRNAKKEARLLTAKQIHALLAEASVYLKAMILLGINCGFGNNDCATLSFQAIDLESGWHNHPRPKTGVPRRGKLWPETVEALREAIAVRRTPNDAANADLVFLTKCGEPWVRWKKQEIPDPSKSALRDAVSILSRLLFRKIGITGGASFYSLRRMTETIGGACKDQVAVDAVMGHSRGDMASVYRLDIEDARLEAVADTIHVWLWPVAKEAVA
ncbi:MAG: tyrosine-type recombinase/integrase [Planctomycetota bacterium]